MSFYRGILIALSAACVAGVSAQVDITSYLGSPYNGQLAPGDSTLNTGEYRDSYQFYVQQGQSLNMTLRSSQLDPYLIYISPGGNQIDNDDGGGGTDSLISAVADRSGMAQVIVTTYRPGETGSYTLRVDAGGSGGYGQSQSSGGERGRLEAGDERLNSGEYVDRWDFQFVQGRKYEITASSSQFDTYLIYVSPGGTQMDDDDSGGGTNARLTIVADRTGTATVSVTSFQPGESGSYTLNVAER